MHSNSYWYLGLSFVSLVLLIYICFKKGTARSLRLLLIMVQLAYSIETVIYIFGHSYQYHPKLLRHSEFYDSNMGALTSNMFIVPTLVVLSALFKLNWGWRLVLIGLLAGVEWLFVELGIYTLYWWRIYYTSFGLLVYFWLAHAICQRLQRPLTGGLHSLFLYLCTAPITGTLHIIPIMLFGNRAYQPGWFANPDQDTTAFSAIYYVCSTIVIVIAVRLRSRHTLLKLLLLTACFYAVTALLNAAALLDSRVWWDPWYYVLFPLFVYWISSKMSRSLASSVSTDHAEHGRSPNKQKHIRLHRP